MEKGVRIAISLAILSFWVTQPFKARANDSILFTDLYSEQTALAQAQTFATYTQLRAGWRLNSKFELYGAARFGADSRTLLDQGTSVYNDNYLFLGAGVDYLGPFTGVRLVFQAGASMDLSSKINAGGFDARTGVVTFHELRSAEIANLYSEIYTESLYIQRYHNLLASAQVRLFYSGFDVSSVLSKRFKFEPMLNLVTSMDSGGLDFNRFFESRAGFRFVYRGPVDVMLIPYYTLGSRFQGPAGKLGYQDFRGLLVVAKSF